MYLGVLCKVYDKEVHHGKGPQSPREVAVPQGLSW
jgi:hypothetical protein